MNVLGIRFCSVSADGPELANFLENGLGLPAIEHAAGEPDSEESAGIAGALFPAGESRIEIWPEGPGMPVGVMLQIIVDDADAWAKRAKANGLDPQGPADAHGERIYFLEAPSGLPITFQSKIAEDAGSGGAAPIS